MTTALVHTGYVLMLFALTARDILWLRSTLVLAQGLLAIYAWRMGVPNIAVWNVVFVTINTIWVTTILRERRAVALPESLRAIHARHFSALTPPEFLRWWGQGQRQMSRDERLTTRGEFPAALVFIITGTVRVTKDDDTIDLSAGHFVGEMSVITDRPATADASVVGEAELIRWPIADLHVLRRRDPVIWTRIQSAVGQDLVAKISAAARTRVEPS